MCVFLTPVCAEFQYECDCCVFLTVSVYVFDCVRVFVGFYVCVSLCLYESLCMCACRFMCASLSVCVCMSVHVCVWTYFDSPDRHSLLRVCSRMARSRSRGRGWQRSHRYVSGMFCLSMPMQSMCCHALEQGERRGQSG